METKLNRLKKIKRETEKVNRELKMERLKQIEEINRKMGNVTLKDAKPFLPYDDPDKTGLRRRSRGLTFAENEALKQYQISHGLPVHKPEPKNPAYPSSHTAPLPKPIGKPTKTPVMPLPSGQPSYPNLSQPQSHSTSMYQAPQPTYPSQPQPITRANTANSLESSYKSKKPTGIKKWFGFGK